MKKIILLILFILLVGTVNAFPQLLDQQGVLRNATTNDLLSGIYAFNISLFDMTGNLVYNETKSLPLHNGIWSYQIGNNLTIPPSIFQNSLYTQIRIGTETLSKVNLTAVPYAFYSYYTNMSYLANTFLNLSGTNANRNINISPYNFTASGLNIVTYRALFSGNMENERGSLGYPNIEIGEDTYPTIIFDDGTDTWMIDYLTGSGLRFYKSGNVHMIVDTTGILTDENVTAFHGFFDKISINTTRSSAELHVKNAVNDSWVQIWEKADSINALGGVYETAAGNSYFTFYDAAGNADINFNTAGDSYIRGGDFCIGCINPTHKLNVIGDANITGNIITNQIYGEMWYHNHTGTQLNFAVDSHWYPMFFTDADKLNGFTYIGGFNSSSNLTAQIAGLYKATYRLSGSGQNNHVYHSTILINNVSQEKCGDHKKISAGGDIVPMGSNCFIDLNIDDNIQVAVRDYGGTGTGDYYTGIIDLVRIGD